MTIAAIVLAVVVWAWVLRAAARCYRQSVAPDEQAEALVRAIEAERAARVPRG